MLDEKATIRRMVRFRRREFVDHAGPAACAVHAIALARILFDRLAGSRCIALYVSNGREIDPRPTAELAVAAGLTVALPRLRADGAMMDFAAWIPGERLFAGLHGTTQPAATAPAVRPDLILAPLVAFDRTGARLGQGGGFYDRVFEAHPDARRIGLGWSIQEIAHVPVESWDKPLHAIATEKEWIDCA